MRYALPASPNVSSLDAQHLLEGMHHFDQIILLRDHPLDIFVRRRYLVDYGGVFTALHAGRLPRHVLDVERARRRRPAHFPARAMRARAERFRITFAAHHVGFRAHAARNDAKLARTSAYRTLARHVHLRAEVAFIRHVIVMAIDRLVGDAVRRQLLPQRLEHQVHHLAAVRNGVILGPFHGLQIVAEVARALAEIGEVPVRQRAEMLAHVLLRELDKILADGIADAAAARVQHHPHVLVLVETQLDEVIAAAQCPELAYPGLVGLLLRRINLFVLAENASEADAELLDRGCPRLVLAVHVKAHRYRLFDGEPHAAQAIRQITGLDRQPHRIHAAADVHAYRCRDDRAPGRDHRPHRGADAHLHIRQRRDLTVDKR